MSHKCHVPNCMVNVKPQKLMCITHWKMVTPETQEAVLSSYRPGQCNNGRPSKEWLEAARKAIGEVQLVQRVHNSQPTRFDF